MKSSRVLGFAFTLLTIAAATATATADHAMFSESHSKLANYSTDVTNYQEESTQQQNVFFFWRIMEWLSDKDWKKFGLGPVLAYVVGFTLVTLPLEFIIRYKAQELSDSKRFIVYNTESRTRLEARAKTEEKVELKNQIRLALINLIGPPAIINGIFSWWLMTKLLDSSKVTIYPGGSSPASWDWKIFLVSFFFLQLTGDFFLYWGHRIQHEYDFLWKLHSVHHTLDSPTPIGTLYIDPIDATLQGALPMMLAIIIVQPDLFTTYLYIALRVGENAVNHYGIDSWIFDILTLKCLPFRASVAHHDSHHKLSKHAMGAKNYGENFWIWDYVFGTWKDYSAIHVVAETNVANNDDKNYNNNNDNDNVVVKRTTDKQVDIDNNYSNNSSNSNNEEDDIVKPRRRGRPSSKSPSKRK